MSKLKKLDEVINISCADGNWDANEYCWGMANGLILARHIMRGDAGEPPFLEKPKLPDVYLAAAVAVSLYQYNVSPAERATKIYEHFEGACAEIEELLALVDSKNWATSMAMPTARIYLMHAMERYGLEAINRVKANLDG